MRQKREVAGPEVGHREGSVAKGEPLLDHGEEAHLSVTSARAPRIVSSCSASDRAWPSEPACLTPATTESSFE